MVPRLYRGCKNVVIMFYVTTSKTFLQMFCKCFILVVTTALNGKPVATKHCNTLLNGHST